MVAGWVENYCNIIIDSVVRKIDIVKNVDNRSTWQTNRCETGIVVCLERNISILTIQNC